MYNGKSVFLGIVVFVALALAPVWINLSSGEAAAKPDPKLPENYDKCVMEKEFMTAYHMDLLNEWRDKVVREDVKIYVKDGKIFTIDGAPAEMSLTKTCMKCHSNKAEFCDQCHNYLDVVPYCWDCHIEERSEPYALEENREALKKIDDEECDDKKERGSEDDDENEEQTHVETNEEAE